MPKQLTPETPTYQCRHLFTDGHRCGSRALRYEPFYYYHHGTRKPDPDRLWPSTNRRVPHPFTASP